MKVLVTGSGGQLGAAIVERFERDGEVVALAHADLDIADRAAVAAAVERHRPGAVINCAAYNDVDGAEDAAAAALRVNAFGVLSLARAAAARGATLVHYSTDFVFDGRGARPYTEEDRPAPASVYAASKLLGEWFAAEAPRHYVLRVESLFGSRGGTHGATRRGSLGTIVDRIFAGSEVPVFVDRTVSPTYSPDVADATHHLLASGVPSGLYHCVNTGTAPWADVAAEAARLLGRELRLTPLTLENVGLRAARPKYCALSNERLRRAGIAMPTWQDALARYLSRYPPI